MKGVEAIMRLKKRTKRIFKYIVIGFMIVAMLLPIVANFLPQKQSNEIDPKLLQAYLESQNEDEKIEIPDIEGAYQVVDIPAGNILTVLWGDEERDVKLIGVKEVSTTAEALKTRVQDDLIQLEFDAVEEDENGTLLAYAYHSDGTFINRDLILHGEAKADLTDQNNIKYQLDLEEAQALAKSNQVGCWGAK